LECCDDLQDDPTNMAAISSKATPVLYMRCIWFENNVRMAKNRNV